MISYAPVTSSCILPAGWRGTAYYWAAHRGLPITLGYLQELGLRAARYARWLGLEQAAVPEGPFWVHTWPGEIWAEAEVLLAGDLEAWGGRLPGPGYTYADWVAEGDVPWDSDDFRTR